MCKDQLWRLAPTGSHERSTNAVASDVDRLLGPKTLPELAALEKQISNKLSSNEPIDVEYWEQLLRSITIYKSKAELDRIYMSIIQGRLKDFQTEQTAEAELSKRKLSLVLTSHDRQKYNLDTMVDSKYTSSCLLDPEPQLKLHTKDKGLEIVTNTDFVDRIVRSPNPDLCYCY